MRRVLFLVVPLCAAMLAHGSWYWPFGSKEDDPSEPLRLHRLLEEANNYIEIAEDEVWHAVSPGEACAAGMEQGRLAAPGPRSALRR